MMDRERAARTKGPPPGEYVVRHERPYPEKLDRAVRITAIAAAILAGLALAGAVSLHLPNEEIARSALRLSAAFVLASLLTGGGIYAAGMILIGVVTLFREKQYVVAWDEPQTVEQHNRQVMMFFGVVAMICALVQAAHRWL